VTGARIISAFQASLVMAMTIPSSVNTKIAMSMYLQLAGTVNRSPYDARKPPSLAPALPAR